MMSIKQIGGFTLASLLFNLVTLNLVKIHQTFLNLGSSTKLTQSFSIETESSKVSRQFLLMSVCRPPCATC